MYRINRFFIALILLGFLFLQCDDGIIDPDPGEPPVADFIFQIQSGTGTSVSFASSSTNANTLIWDFGDGSRSTRQAPNHTFSANGTYQVSLTASNNAGISTIMKEVVIDGIFKPVADFEIDFEGVNSSLQVNLTNLSSNAEEFVWDFGDSNTSTNGSVETYTYSSPGTYKITLTAINDNESLQPNDREDDKEIEVTFLDNDFLHGGGSKSWKFKADSIRLVYDFTLDTVDQEGNPTKDVFPIDTLVSSYHITRVDTLFFQVPLDPECMLDDVYTFGMDRSYQNMNNGNGRLLEFAGQCAVIEEPAESRWDIVRDDNSFTLILVNNYIGDSEVGFFFEVRELSENLLVVEAETTAPNSDEIRKVVMAFEPE